MTEPFFISFEKETNHAVLPTSLTFVENGMPHELAALAAAELQLYLLTQQDWQHNFGLGANEDGTVIGKMFGVLVVQKPDGEIGYLAAFSGKLAGGNHHSKFVPPVFDLLTDGSFLNTGMTELTHMNEAIRGLEAKDDIGLQSEIERLKTIRRDHSNSLQKQIFEHYHFLNQQKEKKSLYEIFHAARNTRPPAGAGECAAPKLLQYAFNHDLKPLAIAEFWWGQSPKSIHWKHKEFYPCCKEKCEPILAWMLG